MKILHINTIDTGGAAKAAIRLHLLLLENGIDSKILFLKRSGNEIIREAYYFEDRFKSHFFFKCLEKLNSLFNRRFTFYKPNIYFNGPDSLFDLSKHYLFKSSDTIHFHWVVKFLDWKRVFKNKNKNYVWTLHDMNPFTGGQHYETGYHKEFSRIAIKNIKSKIRAIENCKIIVVSPSHWLANEAQNSQIFKVANIQIIRNPINTNTFNIKEKQAIREKYQLPLNKTILLFVAENPNDERKGYILLLNALEALDIKNNYHLAVIGNATDLPENISSRFLGTITNELIMAELYNSADLFVIPSREDNLPNTVSEALLCGVPVAGYSIGGIPELVKNGINGTLSNQSEYLKKAIEDTISARFDPESIRNSALSELAPEIIFKKIMMVYNNN